LYLLINKIDISSIGGCSVDKHWLYDADMPTKMKKRCCTLLHLRANPSKLGWHFSLSIQPVAYFFQYHTINYISQEIWRLPNYAANNEFIKELKIDIQYQ
jgi:hypothetical protein